MMSICHEWFSVVGTLYYHDRMMREENEKGTMLEDTYEAKGIRWSSGEKTKEH